MKKVFKHSWQTYSFVTVLTLLLVIVIFYFGDQYSLNKMSLRQVTPNQLSSAMDNDDFFSKFRYDTLIFNGQVTSVYKYKSTQVASIATTTNFKLNCQVEPNQVEPGRTYRFLTEAYRASRQSNGVMLYKCVTF